MEYGLIGKPLKHSFSPELHAKIGAYSYALQELQKEEIASFFDRKTGCDFQGINVTIPYKTQVIPYLDTLDEQAKRIGAVNTIVKYSEGGKTIRLAGYNTDIIGFYETLKHVDVSLEGKKVVILGSGGTAKMLCVAAQMQNARETVIVSRTPEALEETIKKEIGLSSGQDDAQIPQTTAPIGSENNLGSLSNTVAFKGAKIVSYETFYRDHQDVEILLNATPVGMYPNEGKTPIKLGRLKKLEFVFDAIYHPLRTDLVLAAKKRKIKAIGGLEMLVMQGIESAKKFGKTVKDGTAIYREVLAEKQNLVLIGMPSSGKTETGKALSELLQKRFLDTDVLFAEKYKMTAGEFIETYGEKAFRRREKLICKAVSKENGAVIATGGGLPLYKDNATSLMRNGLLIYLERPLSELVPSKTRPLSADQDQLAKLFSERTPRYRAMADLTVSASSNAKETAKRILEAVEAWEEL